MEDSYTVSFKEYVLSEFEKTIQFCSVEDMADFVFGSIEETLSLYKDKMKKSGISCD